MYRVLGDFYPEASTPQLLAQTVFVPGAPPAPPVADARLLAEAGREHERHDDHQPRDAGGRVCRRGSTSRSIPPMGYENYLGVWAHMLAASDDLIDMMHTHPMIADGGPTRCSST